MQTGHASLLESEAYMPPLQGGLENFEPWRPGPDVQIHTLTEKYDPDKAARRRAAEARKEQIKQGERSILPAWKHCAGP